ncbi:hypothetical protein ANCDUO_16165 [Ancylostoma duodenale]|uniref:Amidase domain-containing protein n=1 Tax=Ancylostoma duodenale TaxID=51022 RepID=A0A0C2FYK2_9BILA|nr:hypothetical protein ANCDUO_16165 [Ancylostoma duodenale]
MCSTLGYVQELYTPSKKNAVLVEQLLHHGATTNPYNPERVPGGSSGGEAALIATGGSLLGIGSDVGGSIRIPSTFCGIAGFKVKQIAHSLTNMLETFRLSSLLCTLLLPRTLLRVLQPSSVRFSHTFTTSSIPGRQLVTSNEGPMARSITTCTEYLKVRAVLEAKKILENLGHTLVPFCVPRAEKMFQLFVGGVSADGGKYLARKLKQVWSDVEKRHMNGDNEKNSRILYCPRAPCIP